MPKPSNKTALLDQGQARYDKLMGYVNTLSKAEQNKEFKESYLNRNIRDVLAHIHEWHLMLLQWYEIGMAGEKPKMPAPGYTWKTLPLLNQQIQKQYEGISLLEAKALIAKSHETVRSTITQHTDEELFEKKRYRWTNSTSVGAYFISATFSHYDWGLKLIKKNMK